MDRDRPDPEAPAGADHAAGNLAAIGDQDLLEHQPRLAAGSGANLGVPGNRDNSAGRAPLPPPRSPNGTNVDLTLRIAIAASIASLTPCPVNGKRVCMVYQG